VRERLKGQDLSFTEIAKVVGERWQVVSTEEREECESQANSAKEKYYSRLAEYKKTPQYEAYQNYLEDFRAKHAAPAKGMLFSFAQTFMTDNNVFRRQTFQTGDRDGQLWCEQQPRANQPSREQETQSSNDRLARF
jgi:hypothetical protein